MVVPALTTRRGAGIFPASAKIAAVVCYEHVADAARRLDGVAHQTPVLTSRSLDARLGARAFLKAENLQRGGAFKFRGAFNALSQLSEDARARGVVAYSSGNHAQAVALAGRVLGIPVTVVMPKDAPRAKRAATEGYGARVIEYDRATQRREELAREVQQREGLQLIPPFDHPDVIAGQGTAARELFERVGELDVLLVPCGGGGLLSGSALAARRLSPGCRVVGVEPEAGDDATRSFRSGRLETVHDPKTIADGARTPSLGELTFPLVRQLVDDMLTVSDAQIVRCMRFLWERLKVVVEPTGALGLAAAYAGALDVRGQRVGAILSGGNVDLALALAWFRDAPEE
jgi:threonine dehydratase